MSRSRQLFLFTFSLSVIALIFGESSFAKEKHKNKFTLLGNLVGYQKYDADNFVVATSDSKQICQGRNGYADLTYDMPVTVTNAEGKIVGIGKTDFGEWVDGHCNFNYKVENIPKSDFYSVEVGHRGKVNYSFSDIVQNNWHVSQQIGKE